MKKEEPTPPSSGRFGHRVFVTCFLAFLFGIVASVTFQGSNLLFDRIRDSRVNTQTNFQGLPRTEILEEDSSVTASTDKQFDSEEMEEAVSEKMAGPEETAGESESAQESAVRYGTVAGVAKAAMPSVVAITTVSIQDIASFWGRYRNYASTGTGSGIIIGENEKELLIATNYHVVENASNLSVCFIGDDVMSAQREIVQAARTGQGLNIEDAVSARVKGSDELNDLAVISVAKSEIPDATMRQLKIAQMGSSDNLEVGEQVVAIGNALGYGQTVTSGWVSALERAVTLSNGSQVNLLQTDAAINPGNSGGALLNMKGEVIGINCAKYSSSSVEGTGYAIPISTAEPILEELMALTTRERVTETNEMGALDADVSDLSGGVQWMYGVPDGAFVTNVEPGGACEAAGLQSGDVITRLDGNKIINSQNLLDQLAYYKAGETVNLTICRSTFGYYDYEAVLTVELRNKS